MAKAEAIAMVAVAVVAKAAVMAVAVATSAVTSRKKSAQRRLHAVKTAAADRKRAAMRPQPKAAANLARKAAVAHAPSVVSRAASPLPKR